MTPDTAAITEDDIQQSGTRPLSPAYFAARRMVDAFMCDEAWDDGREKLFQPIIKKVADDLYETLHNMVQDALWSDLENNLQHESWRMVDETVKALLGGKEWALGRYALGDRYDCEEIRRAIAQHIPTELQDARIKDLEAEVAKLKGDVEWMRRHA